MIGHRQATNLMGSHAVPLVFLRQILVEFDIYVDIEIFKELQGKRFDQLFFAKHKETYHLLPVIPVSIVDLCSKFIDLIEIIGDTNITILKWIDYSTTEGDPGWYMIKPFDGNSISPTHHKHHHWISSPRLVLFSAVLLKLYHEKIGSTCFMENQIISTNEPGIKIRIIKNKIQFLYYPEEKGVGLIQYKL